MAINSQARVCIILHRLFILINSQLPFALFLALVRVTPTGQSESQAITQRHVLYTWSPEGVIYNPIESAAELPIRVPLPNAERCLSGIRRDTNP